MKPVVVTALALLLLLFLWPMVFLGGPTPAPEESESLPTATLPIDRAAVRPAEEWAGKSDGETVVRVKAHSIGEAAARLDPTDIRGLQRLMEAKRQLQDLEKLHISIN